MAAQQLFPPWEPPPAFTPRPNDAGLEQRITKLTEFVARNGSQFEEMMRQKQNGNPEFAFLFGGEGSPFYRWKLYCTAHQLNPELPLEAQGHGQPSGAPGPGHIQLREPCSRSTPLIRSPSVGYCRSLACAVL